jgi:hypothetical protein
LAHATTREHYDEVIRWLASEDGVYGNEEVGKFTYLQTTEFKVEGYFDNDFSIDLEGKPVDFIRIYLDTQELGKMRKVFIDPESLDATPEDYGKSFVIRGGIPRQALRRIEVVKKLEKILWKKIRKRINR